MRILQFSFLKICVNLRNLRIIIFDAFALTSMVIDKPYALAYDISEDQVGTCLLFSNLPIRYRGIT